MSKIVSQKNKVYMIFSGDFEINDGSEPPWCIGHVETHCDICEGFYTFEEVVKEKKNEGCEILAIYEFNDDNDAELFHKSVVSMDVNKARKLFEKQKKKDLKNKVSYSHYYHSYQYN